MQLEFSIFPSLENPIPTQPLVYMVDNTMVISLSLDLEYCNFVKANKR